jgi:hypothetical protein
VILPPLVFPDFVFATPPALNEQHNYLSLITEGSTEKMSHLISH